MTGVFLDTSFLVAFLSPRDSCHEAAQNYLATLRVPMITTRWVLAELGNYLAKGANRGLFGSFVQALGNDARVRILSADEEHFHAGLDLYVRRSDKDWSFTDCVSFVVMGRHNLSDALTADHHFEQAGFTALLL